MCLSTSTIVTKAQFSRLRDEYVPIMDYGSYFIWNSKYKENTYISNIYYIWCRYCYKLEYKKKKNYDLRGIRINRRNFHDYSRQLRKLTHIKNFVVYYKHRLAVLIITTDTAESVTFFFTLMETLTQLTIYPCQ